MKHPRKATPPCICSPNKIAHLYMAEKWAGLKLQSYAQRRTSRLPLHLRRLVHRHALRRRLPPAQFPATFWSRSEYAQRKRQFTHVQRPASFCRLGSHRFPHRHICPVPSLSGRRSLPQQHEHRFRHFPIPRQQVTSLLREPHRSIFSRGDAQDDLARVLNVAIVIQDLRISLRGHGVGR